MLYVILWGNITQVQNGKVCEKRLSKSVFKSKVCKFMTKECAQSCKYSVSLVLVQHS